MPLLTFCLLLTTCAAMAKAVAWSSATRSEMCTLSSSGISSRCLSRAKARAHRTLVASECDRFPKLGLRPGSKNAFVVVVRAFDCWCYIAAESLRYQTRALAQLRQLPPATGKAPFVVEPRVRNFDFRVLRQNRRVVQDETRRDEIELFHEILTDISMCEATQSVRDFIIAAYVRGGVRIKRSVSERCRTP